MANDFDSSDILGSSVPLGRGRAESSSSSSFFFIGFLAFAGVGVYFWFKLQGHVHYARWRERKRRRLSDFSSCPKSNILAEYIAERLVKDMASTLTIPAHSRLLTRRLVNRGIRLAWIGRELPSQCIARGLTRRRPTYRNYAIG